MLIFIYIYIMIVIYVYKNESASSVTCRPPPTPPHHQHPQLEKYQIIHLWVTRLLAVVAEARVQPVHGPSRRSGFSPKVCDLGTLGRACLASLHRFGLICFEVQHYFPRQ